MADTVVVISETEEGEVTDDSESAKQLLVVVGPKDDEITVDELAFENQGKVELSVETKLVPSNHEGTVADSPGTVSPATGEEEPESVDENPNFIGEEGGVIVLKFENENGEAAFCLSILFSYF